MRLSKIFVTTGIAWCIITIFLIVLTYWVSKDSKLIGLIVGLSMTTYPMFIIGFYLSKQIEKVLEKIE